MKRRVWMPGGKGGGGRYVLLSDLVREYQAPVEQPPYFGPSDPGTDPLRSAVIFCGLFCLGAVVTWGILFLAGKVL